MSKPTELTTFTLQLDQLLRGEAIPDETPELAFARRLRAVDLASRSRSETSLRARLLSLKNSPTFPPTPMKPPHRNSLPSRLAPTLAFGAAMVLLVLFLAWALTNTTPQPAVNATETAPVVTPLDSELEESSMPLLVGTPTHAPTTGDPLTVLQTLTTQYANDILSGSGWLHLRTWQFTNNEPSTLYNGALMPNPAIWDDWYQFDDQLQVLYEVSLYMDENGNVNQASIQRDGQSYNLTLGFGDTLYPFNPNFDLDFTERAANLIAEGETLNMSDFSIDGQYSGLMFSIRQGDTEWEAVFNPDTGALLSYTVYQLAAGGKTIQNVMTMLVQEWVAEPPADILAYLDQELKPYAPLPPIGTPAPEGFDASFSDLTFKWIYGDDVNAPTFFYMDVYAEDYLLGRFDSGGTPGGWCDRSFDGAYIAFNYQRPEPDYLTTLRWFNVNEISNLLEPFPALQQNSPPSFAPQDLRMAFGACEAGNCGYYIYNLQTGELTKITDGPAYASPAWTPDGNYLVYLIPAGSENTDLKQGEVIRADTGEVVFTGTTNEILQKYGVTVPTGASGLSCERAPDTSPDTQPVLNPDGTYTVQDGDTLSQIASDFGLTVETLIALNGLSPESSVIFPGMVLMVVPFDPANLRFPAQATVNELSNLRTGPGTEFEVVRNSFPAGTSVTVLAATEGFDWYQIVYEASADGTAWIYGPSLTFQPQPPPGLAQSDLTFEWTFTGNAELPNALADIYAGEQYLGQVDFGPTYPQVEPGGFCTRSADGSVIAFTSNSDSLHWFSLEDVETVHELTDFMVWSVSFSPIDSHQLIFTGCNETGCHLWRFDPISDDLQRINSIGAFSSLAPLWSPDGQAIAYIPSGSYSGNFGDTPNRIVVIQVNNGAVLYEGYAYSADSPLLEWGMTLLDWADVQGTTGCETAPVLP